MACARDGFDQTNRDSSQFQLNTTHNETKPIATRLHHHLSFVAIALAWQKGRIPEPSTMTSSTTSVNDNKSRDGGNDDKNQKKKKHRTQRKTGRSSLPPPITCAIMVVLCLSFAILQCLLQIRHKATNLRWKRIFISCEYYRLVTSAVMHSNAQHLGMNLLGIYFSGSQVEKLVGSKRFVWITIISMIITPLLYVSLAYLYDSIICTLFVGTDTLGATKGFSGLIFSWTAIECLYDANNDDDKQQPHSKKLSTRDVYGIIQVPIMWYPWILTAVLLIIDKRSGWLMHISGILFGTAQYYCMNKWDVGINPLKEEDHFATECEDTSITSSTSEEIRSKEEMLTKDLQSIREARLRKFD